MRIVTDMIDPESASPQRSGRAPSRSFAVALPALVERQLPICASRHQAREDHPLSSAVRHLLRLYSTSASARISLGSSLVEGRGPPDLQSQRAICNPIAS